jgi:hypothetical protein
VPDLRSPHGGAASLNPVLPVRAARTATALFCTAALAAGAAGCGGSELDYEEVPGPPVEVTVPSETVDSGAGADADATPTPTATAEPGSTTAPSDQSGDTGGAPSTDSGSGTAATGTTGTDSGGATAPADEDSASNDTAPPAGSEAQQFEDFCAQNPGAC